MGAGIFAVVYDSLWSLEYDQDSQADIVGSTVLENSQALNDFFRTVEKKAYRMAHIATSDPEEALDIVQDSMFKLVDKYGSHEPAEWTPLFYRILQSKIRDWYRRTRIRNRFRVWLGPDRTGDDDSVLENTASENDRGPHQLMETGEQISRLEDALRDLSLRQQQVFLLRAWQGLDVRQTARAMGCSEGSVKTHYSRARQILKARLGQL